MNIGLRAAVGAAAIVGFGGSAYAQGPELVTNGGFEDPIIAGSYSTQTSAFSGFTVTQGNVDIVRSPSYPVASGSQALDLVGTGVSTGQIVQTLATVIGQAYKLTFSYAGNSGSPASTTFTGTAAVNGNSTFFSAPLGAPRTIVSGDISHGAGVPYTPFAGSFIATSTSSLLSFTDTSHVANAGLFLDDVSVTAVPEATTWGMMIMGFGLVGAALRRRKSVTALATA